MTMKKLVDEDDILEIDEGQKESDFFIVKRVEDLIVDKRDFTTDAVATVTESDSINIDDLYPKDITDEIKSGEYFYQYFVGVDIGMIYVWLEASNLRRTPYKIQKPSSSNRYVGHFDELMSPYDMPTFEFFLRHNSIPAFQCYNPWNFNILPDLAFRGRQLQCYNLASDKMDEYFDLGGQRTIMLDEVKKNRRAHRHISMRGIER